MTVSPAVSICRPTSPPRFAGSFTSSAIDPGAELMTIFGLEVLSTGAPAIRFEE